MAIIHTPSLLFKNHIFTTVNHYAKGYCKASVEYAFMMHNLPTSTGSCPEISNRENVLPLGQIFFLVWLAIQQCFLLNFFC